MKNQFKQIARYVERHCGCLSRHVFENHILVLGGSHIVIGLLKSIAHDEALHDKLVVLLTTQEPRAFSEYILSCLTPDEQQLDLRVVQGLYSNDAALRSCHIDKASHIYIVGEDDATDRDMQNVACWKKVRGYFEVTRPDVSSRRFRHNAEDQHVGKQCAERVTQCQVVLFDDNSVMLFHALQQEAHTRMETTIVSYYESVARRLLVADTILQNDHTLDRGLVTAGNGRYVHLVVFGMSPMGCAVATTAAHLCHFPNFDSAGAQPIRTKITFIDPHADVMMNYFKARYSNLFDLSHSVYASETTGCVRDIPDSRYGDFLDVEWAFVKASAAEGWVRGMLEEWLKDERQVLSVAVCGNNGQYNLDEALCLPRDFYVVPDNCESTEPRPLVYVYQPTSGVLTEAAGRDILRYGNLVPFGMDGYVPVSERRVLAAKHANYLRQKDPRQPQCVPDATHLDELWRQLSFDEKMSHLYFADSLFTQLRGFADQLAKPDGQADANMVEHLARVEHARWNMEKLMVGYMALPLIDRKTLNAALQSEDEKIRQEAKIVDKRNRNQRFVLKDITPFSLLPDMEKRGRCVWMQNVMQDNQKMLRTIQSASKIVNLEGSDTSYFEEIDPTPGGQDSTRQ